MSKQPVYTDLEPGRLSDEEQAAKPDDLIEQLAAIEHERWSDWQKWVHSKLVREQRFEGGEHFLTGNLILNGDDYGRWQRQIDTPYEKLSEAEKNSDREQVERYWPLIESYVARQVAEARKDEFMRCSLRVVSSGLRADVKNFGDAWHKFTDYNAKRVAELTQEEQS